MKIDVKLKLKWWEIVIILSIIGFFIIGDPQALLELIPLLK
jgi:hypothetical protein